jgi:septal ring factor EnvC (AmiA/AmiB activator)
LQRKRWAAEQRRAMAELQKQREAIERRSEHVDKSRAALEQLRDELGRVHRETLDVRLATEELWARLCNSAPPAALTRSLESIRNKLANHYRLSNDLLREQRAELEHVRGQLVEQHQKLVDEKCRFEQWIGRRQKEMDQQATHLTEREKELQQREAELQHEADRWQAERQEYQEEIHRLQRLISKPPRIAVPA